MLENGMVLEMDRHLNSLEEQEYPICPQCGSECDTFYNDGNEIVGCEHCITTMDAWEK